MLVVIILQVSALYNNRLLALVYKIVTFVLSNSSFEAYFYGDHCYIGYLHLCLLNKR